MKRNIVVSFVLIACIILIIFSYFSWRAKINTVRENAANTIETNANQATTGEKKFALSQTVLEDATSNSSKALQDLFSKRYLADKKIQMLILGSSAMKEGGEGYAKYLKNSLADRYGDFVKVTSQSFDTNSADFIAKHLNEVKWSQKYDVILFEPFIFKDNGQVPTADEFGYIDQVVSKAKSQVKDAVVVLQPSFPIYNPGNYKTNVDELKKYASTKKLSYIDHWSKWPDTNNSILKGYLTEDNTHVNEQGAKTWAGALSRYFTNK